MTTYTRCAKCGHQQMFTGNFLQKPCPKCGHGEVDMSMGSKPSWWKQGASE